MEREGFLQRVGELLDEIQAGLLEEATAFRDANIRDVSSFEDLREAIEGGYWARGPWAGQVLMKPLFRATVPLQSRVNASVSSHTVLVGLASLCKPLMGTHSGLSKGQIPGHGAHTHDPKTDRALLPCESFSATSL